MMTELYCTVKKKTMITTTAKIELFNLSVQFQEMYNLAGHVYI